MAVPSKKKSTPDPLKYEAVKIDSIFPVLDGIAWLDNPTIKSIAQFAGIDGRTAGKVLKNCCLMGVAECYNGDTYALKVPYPYKGSTDQKKAVIREALLRLSFIISVKQFINLGDSIDVASRKAATIAGKLDYNRRDVAPLIKWAENYNVLNPQFLVEDLIEEAVTNKEARHRDDKQKTVAFISHSSLDKPFIRQLASDLVGEGVAIWLDEQKILVGDSIPEKISQGLAESDYFLIGLSEASVKSPWVRKELNSALISEIEKREVKILPLKLSDCEIPELIKDKKYADFSSNYKKGLEELLRSLRRN